MKYLPYILAVGLMAYIYFAPAEIKIVDRTKHFQAKVDSLKDLNESLNEAIDQRDQVIAEKELQNDSLREYQDKIYIYYAKEIQSIRNTDDSLVYGIFTDLLK